MNFRYHKPGSGWNPLEVTGWRIEQWDGHRELPPLESQHNLVDEIE